MSHQKPQPGTSGPALTLKRASQSATKALVFANSRVMIRANR